MPSSKRPDIMSEHPECTFAGLDHWRFFSWIAVHFVDKSKSFEI